MKRVVSLILFIIFCFLLQTTVFQALKLADTVPNLLLIVVVAIGYMRGRYEAMFLGFFCGLLVDCEYSSVIGVYAFLYAFIGYLNGLCNMIYYRDNFAIPIILVAISDFIFNFGYYVLVFLLRNRTDFLFYLRKIILPEMVYTVLLSIFIYKLVHILITKLEKPMKEGGINV